MKEKVKTILFLLVATILASCASNQIRSTDEKVVNLLIEQLASPAPPKYSDGETLLLTLQDDAVGGFVHPQVARAKTNLVAMGTRIYPILVKHHDDPRYSYSTIAAAWRNESVGQMIDDIMADGIELCCGGYKERQNPHGFNGPPDFSRMIHEIGFKTYAEHAKSHTKAELQKEYILWRIQKERAYGFISPQQEQHCLGSYLKRLGQL